MTYLRPLPRMKILCSPRPLDAGFKAICAGRRKAVAKNVIFIEDDISNVDTNAKLNSDVCRDVCIVSSHAALNLGRTAGRIDGAGKLDQHSVTGCLDDTPMMGGNGGIDKALPNRLEPGERPFLVQTHEPAVPSDVRREYSRQPSLRPFSGQKKSLDW